MEKENLNQDIVRNVRMEDPCPMPELEISSWVVKIGKKLGQKLDEFCDKVVEIGEQVFEK